MTFADEGEPMKRDAGVVTGGRGDGPARAVAVAFCLCALMGAGARAGWVEGYGYRKGIHVESESVSGSEALTDFPLLVSVSDADLAWTNWGGGVSSASGHDIVFTEADGTSLLDHEVELYQTNGQLVAWVRVPSLSATTDTGLFVYYGNGAVTSATETAAAVWGADERLVLHMAENPAGSPTGAVYDSTSFGNHATVWQNMSAANWVAAQIGKGVDFDGANDYMRVAHDESLDFADEDFTVSWWGNCGSCEAGSRVFCKGNWSDPGLRYESYAQGLLFADEGKTVFAIDKGGATTNKNEVTWTNDAPWDGAWHSYAVVRDTGARVLSLYVDGALAVSGADKGGALTNACALYIGDGLADGSEMVGLYKDFTIDEFRVSGCARSADWLATCHDNQAAPSAFYSVGPELAPGGDDWILFEF